MAYDFNGTADYIEGSNIPAIDVPVTLSCWFNSDTNNAAKILLAVAAGSIVSGTTLSPGLSLRLTATTANVQAATSSGNGSNVSTSGNTYATGVWNHAAARFASTSSRIVYLNGVKATEQSTNRAVAGTLVNVLIGRGSGGTYLPSGPFNGRLAELGIWNVALDDDEIISLSKGIKPIYVRPQSLLYYVALVRDIKDDVSAISLTSTSPVVFDHTRRYG
jgi:hypothetical protein